MKEIMILTMITASVLCLTGCGIQGASPAPDLQPVRDVASSVSGGWELTSNPPATLPAEVSEAFDKAVEGKSDGMIPVAFVGEQVVAGMNYMLLCADTSDGTTTGYRMIVIYRDLQGNSTLTGDTPFILTKYTGQSSSPSDEELVGGWQAPEDISVQPLDANVQKVFDKAAKSIPDSDMEPMALLGTQVVAGVNYAFLCRVTPSSSKVPSVQIITVYADLQDNAQITDQCVIDQAEFN